MDRHKDVLICGAGIAGHVAAWWLREYGFRPAVVEQAPELRDGGHAVDLWGAAVDIIERMGLLPEVEAARTRNDCGVMITPGHAPIKLDLDTLSTEFADRQIEIMRGDLVQILHRHATGSIEYIFGDTITGLDVERDGVLVSFQHARPRRFALVIGADGQHSAVRRLMFGDEPFFRRYIGGYICGCTIADDLAPSALAAPGRIHRYVAPGKSVTAFPIPAARELGVGFLFRRPQPVDLHHDDVHGQKSLVREVFSREGWEIPQLLAHLDDAPFFYFDAFNQIRMETWSKGPVTLAGDAAYCPAPAVGGGTSMAVIGAYFLAGELAEACGNVTRAFVNYESAMRPVVHSSRMIGPALVKALLPMSQTAISLSFRVAPLMAKLPRAIRRWIPLLPRKALKGMRAIAAAPVRTYQPRWPGD